MGPAPPRDGSWHLTVGSWRSFVRTTWNRTPGELFHSPSRGDKRKEKENPNMGKEKIMRRQKDVSRLIREKKKIQKDRVGKRKKIQRPAP